MVPARRRWLQAAIAIAAAPLLGAAAGSKAKSKPTVIKIVAERFHYTPNEINLKVGRDYVLEISSLDFIHGFNLPDLKKRTNLIPGMITKIEVKFDKPGTYDFLCDNFCGDGHEEMSGKFLVKA
jgi:cytochrome c oxidase subunit II